MYKVNDTVIYETQRVCRITEISAKDVSGKSMEYYVLKPLYDGNTTMFVPVHNELATIKMRGILSVDEIYDLIHSLPDENFAWLDDDKRFRDRCREILAAGDRTEILKLIKALHLHVSQHVQKTQGKPHSARENSMKDAAKMLYEEFSHVLEIGYDQVLPFILGQMQTDGRR